MASNELTEPKTIQRIVDFHGHMCPGLAMGIRASEVALQEIGAHSQDEEVVAIVETDMCGVDAIQFLTGCTFGKGNLVHKDHGKNAYTFIRRSDGRAVRVSTRPGAFGAAEPESDGLFAKVRTHTATRDEFQRFLEGHLRRSEEILAAPLDSLYDVREVQVEAPQPARILASVDCQSCGEPTMETRIRRIDGLELCSPCFDDALSGRTPVASPRVR